MQPNELTNLTIKSKKRLNSFKEVESGWFNHKFMSEKSNSGMQSGRIGGECVKDDMKVLGLQPDWAIFRDMWRDLIWGKP